MSMNMFTDLFVIIVIRPLLVMWAWNQLTPYDIEYEFWNWLAVMAFTMTFARPLRMAVYPWKK